MEFNAQPRTVRDALDLKRKYIIPRFQREYSWEVEELDTLWDDLFDNVKIEAGLPSAAEYFMGSLVLVGDDDDTQSIERQVVDGQQRLMTFTIAFSVLSQLFKQIKEDRLSEIVHSYIIGEDENGIAYTKVVSETPKPFFQFRIQQKEIDFTQIPKSREEKRILAAYQFFENKLSKRNLEKELSVRFPKATLMYADMLKLFRDQILKCKVIYVTVNSFDDAYTIFEVLNAKGKDLTPVDIIKNTLFSILDQTEPVDAAYVKWGNIRASISEGKIDDIMTFYRHFWLSQYGLTTNKKLVDEFNKKIEKNQKSYENFLNELEVAASDYVKIALPNPLHWPQPEDRVVFETLEALDGFGITQVRTFLLALLDVNRKGLIKHKEFLNILSYLQYFHFVFNAVCSERPSGLERRYSSYSRKLRTSKKKEESARCLHELIEALKASLPSYEEFENSFLKINYTSSSTRDKRLVQYILKKVERYASGTDEMRPDSFSIEHILPESTRNKVVGRMGNLLPLGVDLNSKIGDKAFAEKMKGYQTSQYQAVKLFIEHYRSETVWDEDKINQRTIELAKIMYYQNNVSRN